MKAIFNTPEKSIKISTSTYLYVIYFVMMICLVFITQTGYSQSNESTYSAAIFKAQNNANLELASVAEMNTDFYKTDKTNAEQNIDRATFVGNDLVKNYIAMLSQIENQLNRNYFVKLQTSHKQIIELRLDKAAIMVADKL